MAIARKSRGFTALRVEGGILPPEFLNEAAALRAPRQAPADYGLTRSFALKDEIARYWRIGSDLYAQRNSARGRLDPLLRRVFGYADLTAAGSAALDDRVFKLTHRACGGAVPLLLTPRGGDLDRADPRFGSEGRRQTPHGLMQEYLNAEDGCLWGIVSNGAKLRILRDNPSLTRRAAVEADLELIFQEELYADFSALWLLAHASRLQPPGGGKPAGCIMEIWRRKAHETGERALADLRHGVADSLRSLGNGFLEHPGNEPLRNALRAGELSTADYFRQLLALVYRLLFLLAAEDRGLLHAPRAGEDARAVYAQGYSLSRLRERALRRRHYDRRADDLWQSLRIVFRVLDGSGAPALALPALGGLFRAAQCPRLDDAAIANDRLLAAVRSLAFLPSGRTLARVNYRDMDTEELGSVYESLLDLRPAVDAETWTFDLAGGPGEQTRGSERKLTGSYYTPPALVNELIRSTLDPVLERAAAEREDPRAAILALKVVDPACGSGHFLLAAARRMAARLAELESDAGVSDDDARRSALRAVAQHCIYGVDRNPLAVDLCRAALWMEAVEPGKPLTFLDAHIRQGDSLVGVLDPAVMAEGIPDKAYAPLAGDDKAVCLALRKRNRQTGRSVQYRMFDEAAAQDPAAFSGFEDMAEETLADVERKRAAWEASRRNPAPAQERRRADLFVGAFFAEKTRAAMEAAPLAEDLNRLDKGLAARPGAAAALRESAERRSFFHWRTAFPEIMRRGGFDAVLGNPPWERIKLQEQEFFAVRSPEIAAARNKAARKQAIEKLARADAPPAERALFAAFQAAKRDAEATSQWIRAGGRFPLTGVGDVNTYAVFAETFLQLLHPRGRAGLIAPSGIASDYSTQAFFNEIAGKGRLVSLYDFENREKVFPGIDSRIKFCLLTLTGAALPCSSPEFACFLYRVEHLREDERRFALSAEDIALFNPNTRTCPVFRARKDMEIARKMYRRAGVFWRDAKNGEPEANPWGVKFSAMFHMSNDSGLFHTREQLEQEGWRLRGNVFVRGAERCLPLYEAKLFHQYDHRFATFEGASAADLGKGNARPMTDKEKADPEAVVIPRYWVSEDEVLERLDKRGEAVLEAEKTLERHSKDTRKTLERHSKGSTSSPASCSQEYHERDQRADGDLRGDSGGRLESLGNGNRHWLIAFRDIASPTNQRTSIFAVLPEGPATNHKAPLLHIGSAKRLRAGGRRSA